MGDQKAMSRIDNLRRDLTTPLTTLQGELNRVLRTYWGAEGAAAEAEAEAEAESKTEPEEKFSALTWVPELDLVETPVEYAIWVDLPGVSPDSIELAVTGRTLSLRGTKLAEPRSQGAQEHLSERIEGRFHRVLELPGVIDLEAIAAEARQGVLHIRLPKAAAAIPRTIPVQPKSSVKPAGATSEPDTINPGNSDPKVP